MSGDSWIKHVDYSCKYIVFVYVSEITTMFSPIYGLFAEIC